MDDNCGEWVESMGVATGCGCKEVYRFPRTTYPYSCICSFLQQHPYFLFIFFNYAMTFFCFVFSRIENSVMLL